ncbi:MAG: glycosyltransferase family 39 protein [Puia sp.]|nr:glycosyltransferase family 39 protein [Puia sp.]
MQKNDRGFIRAGMAMIGACVGVYLCGWHIPLMEIDAVQYANISREMMRSGHYLQVFDRGHDYLDKPPMLFWLSAFSMKLFGVSGWAYRLPSLLFGLLAIYSTFRLASEFYRREIALLSAVILASCQALFLINHDVRTDTMLMGWVTFSLWQLAAWYRTRSWRHWCLAAVAIAGGMMTKGPIALMVPVFCFGPHFLLQRSWRSFLRWELIPMIFLIAVLLLPMCIGLYEQYDLHPGKVINGQPIRSGLRFFFWTQSFGRVTGESQWHENDSFFFLFQNMLWSFLPWILFFVIGLVSDIRHLFRNRWELSMQEEWITTGGFLVTYCALGLSHYQLPHYLFVVFPLAAIISAKAFYRLFFFRAPLKGRRLLFIIHVVIFGLLWVALLLLLFVPFPAIGFFLKGAAVAAAAGWVWLLTRMGANEGDADERDADERDADEREKEIRTDIKQEREKATRTMTGRWKAGCPGLLLLTVYTVVGVNFFLDLGVYPALLDYQLSSVVIREMRIRRISPERLYPYRMDEEWALDFYTDHLYRHTSDPFALAPGSYILTNRKGLDSLGAHAGLDLVYTGGYFHVSTLDLPFLNPATRDSELTPVYILERK